ncbi:MAG: thioredoxin fold domain-containing protein [Cellvibrionaceae bacterium]
MKYPALISVSFLVIGISNAYCGDSAKSPILAGKEIADHILHNLKKGRSDLNYSSEVYQTNISNIYQVKVEGGPDLYVNTTGDFFIAGDLFQIDQGEFINLKEKDLEKKRVKSIASIDKNLQIIFPAKEPFIGYINVFTDVDCFYCQKLHKDIDKINGLGIEVRYLAYPRAGLASDSARKMESAWCSKNKQEALTNLKNQKVIERKSCSKNTIAQHYQLGNQLGVNGTPSIFLKNGKMFAGYLQPERIKSELLNIGQ